MGDRVASGVLDRRDHDRVQCYSADYLWFGFGRVRLVSPSIDRSTGADPVQDVLCIQVHPRMVR